MLCVHLKITQLLISSLMGIHLHNTIMSNCLVLAKDSDKLQMHRNEKFIKCVVIASRIPTSSVFFNNTT